MLPLLLLWGLLISLGCVSTQMDAQIDATATAPVEEDLRPEVRIGQVSYFVDLAVLPGERQQGLSGRESMAGDTGMLFVFEDERPRNFWMKEMHFPLDIIWIDAQCRLLDVAADVPTPPPNAGNEEIPRVWSPGPVRYVLEVNAGEAARNGLLPGDEMEFVGAIEGQYGC